MLSLPFFRHSRQTSIHSFKFRVPPPALVHSARPYTTETHTTKTPEKHSEQALSERPITRKHRVDLKPSPIKPSTHGVSSTHTHGPTSQPPQPSHSNQTSQAVTHDSRSHVKSLELEPSTSQGTQDAKSKEAGPINLAQKDIKSAYAHGILMPPPPGASLFQRLYHQAKELFKFYYAGIKMIFVNQRQAKEIQRRAKEQGVPLTWWETKFIRTCRSDILK